MKESSNPNAGAGCGLGCLVFLLAMVAIFGHMLYIWPAANILHVGQWVPAQDEGYTFVFDQDAKFLGVYVTGCLVSLIGGCLFYFYYTATPSPPAGRWADVPSAQDFNQLETIVEGDAPACFLEFQSRRETRAGRPGLGFFSGMFWVLVGLQLGNALVCWGIASPQLLGSRLSFPRLGMLAALMAPGLWKMLVGFRAIMNRNKIDDRLLVRWQERNIYLVDLLNGRDGELYVPFSKIRQVELITSRYSNQQTPHSPRLAIQGEGGLTIPLWGGELPMLERIRSLGRKLAERLGCSFVEVEKVLPPFKGD